MHACAQLKDLIIEGLQREVKLGNGNDHVAEQKEALATIAHLKESMTSKLNAAKLEKQKLADVSAFSPCAFEPDHCLCEYHSLRCTCASLCWRRARELVYVLCVCAFCVYRSWKMRGATWTQWAACSPRRTMSFTRFRRRWRSCTAPMRLCG